MQISEQIKFLLDFFGVKKLWDIIWVHAINSQKELSRFSHSNETMMIEGDISMSDEGEIIMAHPPKTSSDLKYEDWIQRSVQR